ncbi:hypothetical protein TGAM01_v202124 [Trichoderma gamsii]|uniref:Protein kinase domain-containing protein n=1 Tax=Trichoderma gamsii TaxID=398673 RepID=A0A2P4ZXL6_9HYPO|nr:hypothetical protein TGAM01_v202124 [Trichoderma gamsii]PON29016.1 hypothetical protein TGAM01_v202124 [Trichoderma gamsii]
MTDPFVEVKMEVEDLGLDLLQGIRHRDAFPRHRKRFDREDDERRYQDFVRSECDRRSEERREIGRKCDELYERLFQKLKRERDGLFERQCQKLDDEFEELFDREHQKIQRQVEQRQIEQRQIEQRQIEQRKQQLSSLSEDELPLSLTNYLTACHRLHLQFKKGACRSLITQKEALSWTFPRRIIPWDLSFQSLQQSVWHRLLPDCYFTEQRMFSSPQRLENVRRTLSPVNSEASLQHFGRYTIESTIMEMLDRLAEDDVLWNGLGLSDDVRVTMEADKDLGQVYEPMLQSSWHKGAGELKLYMRNSHRRAKRQGIWANRSCIYRQLDGENTPVFALMHQLPHRLQLDEIDCGLASEIELVQDVIDKEGRDYKFASKTLVAATITQLYSYMVSKDIRYGCVSTGEAFIFCCISRNDPSNIYCTACVPERDVQRDDPLRLHRTAAASVFALVVHALREKPLPESWYDSVKNLDAWTMGYDDLLDKVRKMGAPKSRPSSAQEHRWRGFDRSPLLAEHMRGRSDRKRGEEIRHWLDNVSGQDVADGDFNENSTKKPNIQDQPFCSHKCLFGLMHGTQMDESCPNYDYHGFGHVDFDEFLSDLGKQLAKEASSDANFIPLGTSSPHKSLFKLRQAAHGYTFVAKEGKGLAHLWSEKLVYDEMEKYQGHYVPLCLGLLELDKPRQGYRRQFEELLLLSWAGRPFQSCLKQISRDQVANKVENILRALHEQGVIYNGSLEPGNFLYDASRNEVMIVNFGESSTPRHAEYSKRGRASYSMPKKRKRGARPDSAMLVFEKDVVDAVQTVLRSEGPRHERRFSELESEVGDDSVSNC